MSALNLLTRFGLSKASGGGPPGATKYGIVSAPSSPATFNSIAQRGPEFKTNAAITVIGARVRVWGNSTETLRLWRVSDKTLLASVTVSALSGQWVEGLFSSPVALANGTNYLITTRGTGSRHTEHVYPPDGYTFAPEISFVRSVTAETDSFPVGNNASMLGLADVIFTT